MCAVSGHDVLMRETLPSYMWRDPCDVLEQKQERELRKTCIGCAHAFEIMFKSGAAMGCELGRFYGNRCKSYKVIK